MIYQTERGKMTIKSGNTYWEQQGLGWTPVETPREEVTMRPSEERTAEVKRLLVEASDKDSELLTEEHRWRLSNRPSPNRDAVVAVLGAEYLAVKAYTDFALAGSESSHQYMQEGE
jgi:hypothetical protein